MFAWCLSHNDVASSSSRMKNRGAAGPKVSHVLSSSDFCEKEQSGRESASVEVGEPWGHETEGKKKKRNRKKQRSPGRAGGMKTGTAFCVNVNVHAHVRCKYNDASAHCGWRMHPRVVYATAARKRTCASFTRRKVFAVTRPDRRLNHASYFTSGRDLAHAYFSISIYHPRVFRRR